jgi:hypothetical protein
MEARALKDKASAFFTKGRFAKAAETYEEFCTLDKKDHQARLRCGDAWSKAGKKDKAIIAYSMAAEGFARDGFLPRAIAASKLVLEIDPAHKGVQKMLAELYAQKSGGSRKSAPSAVAPAPEMEVTRSVSAPVSSSFTNSKAAIDLDAPIARPKPGYKPAKTEAPSPMNRADALELPEYEIPMEDAPSSMEALQAKKGPNPNRRADAIEIDVEDTGPTGPRALVETTIDIDMGQGQPVSGEVEVPIEGQPLPDVDQLPPELQMAQPLAPAVTFDLPPPPPASFELNVEVAAPPPPPPPAAAVYDLTVEVPPEPAAPPPGSGVYELTEAVPDPKPSVPTFELTDVADAPAPAPPPPERVRAAPPPPPPSPPEPAQAQPQRVRAPPERPAPPPPPPEPVRAAPPEKPVHEAPPPPPPEPLPKPAPAPIARAAPPPPPPPKSSALPPSVGDAASAPPSIRPLAATEAAQPPGLKPRRTAEQAGFRSREEAIGQTRIYGVRPSDRALAGVRRGGR